MSTNPDARAWLHVRSDALRRNYARLRESVGAGAALIPMVKADAYGLGVDGVVEALEPEGPWGWGVATLTEALELRWMGRAEAVIVFSPLQPGELDAAISSDVHIAVSSLEALQAVADAAARSGATAQVHVDVDTGMGRTGFDWRSASEWATAIAPLMRGSVAWVGLFTHLHSAEDDPSSVDEQWARFGEALGALEPLPAGVMVHALNSAGAFAASDRARAAIRPGIFLYGGRVGTRHPEPEPVVSLHARVCHVRDVVEGTTLGYGATYAAGGAERWATLSIGYGDGLPRSLGNRGHALLKGRRVPIIGRISMDLTVVDITDVSGVRVGDVATLLGAEGDEEITLDDVAELAGTISYEILTGFTERLPRIWT